MMVQCLTPLPVGYKSTLFGTKVPFLGTKVPCTLRWHYAEGTWPYCNYFISCRSWTVVVLTCFVIYGCVCVCVCVCVGFVMCGFLENSVGVFVICVLVFMVFWLFVLCFCVVFLCTFILVRTTATEWKLNFSNNNNNNNTIPALCGYKQKRHLNIWWEGKSNMAIFIVTRSPQWAMAFS
jgi:hypothetical protein